ncbi:hypothetical protein AAVH_22420 [Aphelenchoides avenae]|nr:hypothetical protein AAVH_22420 [Aphelenchus avenae]
MTFFFFNAVFACSEVQFLCRYLLLCREYEVDAVLRRAAGPIIIILFFMAAQFAWEMQPNPEKTPQLLDVLRKFGWTFDARTPPHVFGCSYSDPIAMVGAALASMHFNLGYVLILWCEFKVYRFIRRNRKVAFTLNTRTHRDVHKALVIMVSNAKLLGQAPKK